MGWFTLAHEVLKGVPIERCLRSHTPKQARLSLLAYEERSNHPNRSDWYAMQICQAIVNSNLKKGKKRYPVKEFQLEFETLLGRKMTSAETKILNSKLRAFAMTGYSKHRGKTRRAD